MKATHPTEDWLQTVFQVIGFERLAFVSDVAEAVPQDETCRLAELRFESDGVRVSGQLTVRSSDNRQLSGITRRLLAVRGVVSVNEIQ
ncbi:hypothetical protein GCM10023189_24270 [Nibrella saemangeumensis]|uniref:BON domain-containing protein n=1 Tax=Nibrella saemangeumensis TaxID=1084526 RepID=A0ABP8MTV7_9BACT